MIDLTLVLPVHNQELIMEQVYQDIERMLIGLGISYECILVENGSTDKTREVVTSIARRYRSVRYFISKKGYGYAVIRGLSAAKGRYVSYMPSDGQVDLGVYPVLWKLIKSDTWDVVKVKRTTRESLLRSIVSSVFSWTISRIFSISALDINGSPRIFLRRWLPALDLTYGDSFIDVEFAVKAHTLGLRIKEIPMKTLPRVGGKSTRSWRTFMEFFINIWQFYWSFVFQDKESTIRSKTD
ncbi:glycosyltransferase family 2 protein [Candidatus Gottesmanbacteria bacterium]|nr:glycosyltransferase family 2 protein [Candidatus Gottesmanbacteria bacterium]